MQIEVPEKLDSPEGWASFLGVSRKTLYKYVYEGRISALRVGGRLLRIPASEIRRLLEADGVEVR